VELQVAELSCTVISDTRYEIITSSVAANEIVTFVAVLEELKLLFIVVSDTGTGVIYPGRCK
jgi:hypothetical protein